MKNIDNLINLVKIENSIVSIFSKLIILDIDNQICSTEYNKNLILLNELFKIENKYLYKVYDYINYFEKEFGNNPLRYVVSEYGCKNSFIDNLSTEVTVNDILLDDDENDLENISTKFLNSLFCDKDSYYLKNIQEIPDNYYSSNNEYRNTSETVTSLYSPKTDEVSHFNEDSNSLDSDYYDNFKIVEYTRSEGNLIYQRIMYSLLSINYNNLIKEIKERNYSSKNPPLKEVVFL